MVTIQRILCPVDLSPISKLALEYAALVARWYRAKIRVVLVEPTVMPPVEMAPMPILAGLTPEARADIQKRVDEFAAKATAGLEVETIVREGLVVPEILAHAEQWPADLAVLGTHGRGGFEHFVLGSVTEKLLRKLRCPILTVPPTADHAPATPGPFTSIVCGVDFSGASLSALEYGFSLAQEAGSRVTIVHTVPWELEDEAELLSPAVSEYRQLREHAARERIAKLVPETVKQVCTVDTVVATGKPAHEIQKVARDTLADLVVMGVHGRAAVSVALFGSTTHAVIRHSPCPVLTVREKAHP